MLSDSVLQKITEVATTVAAQEGCKLYDVEFANQAGQRILRVYIDKENELIGIDDCSNVSKGINTYLDADDVIPGGEYNLEVSSPGLERRLRVPWHFEAAADKKIWMQINQALSNFGVKSQS
ncbi:MAG: ribosome maturation factor RimP, partial [Pseudobdellovibrionaceae bacterium]